MQYALIIMTNHTDRAGNLDTELRLYYAYTSHGAGRSGRVV